MDKWERCEEEYRERVFNSGDINCGGFCENCNTHLDGNNELCPFCGEEFYEYDEEDEGEE